MAQDPDFPAALQAYNESLAATLKASRHALSGVYEAFNAGQQEAIAKLTAEGNLASPQEMAYVEQLLNEMP